MKHFSKYDSTKPVSFAVAQKVWNDETLNTPAYDKIGLYNDDDMNTGGFFWFEDKEDLHFFLQHVWPVVLSGDDLPEEEMNNWLDFTTDFKVNTADKETMLEFVNNYWQGDIHLSWLGTLSELATSTDEIPVSIREWFHEDESPIGNDEKKQFIEFVKAGFC